VERRTGFRYEQREGARVDIRYIAASPAGRIHAWPRSALKRWWLNLRGWTLWDGNDHVVPKWRAGKVNR
jgi:hypothetical protein